MELTLSNNLERMANPPGGRFNQMLNGINQIQQTLGDIQDDVAQVIRAVNRNGRALDLILAKQANAEILRVNCEIRDQDLDDNFLSREKEVSEFFAIFDCHHNIAISGSW